MTQVNIHEAKTHLSRLIAKAARGETIVIAKAGKPIAKLTAISEASPQRKLGRDLGLFKVPDDFDAPLADDILESFEE